MRNKNNKHVGYIGITNNPKRRQNEHKNDPNKQHLYPLEVKISGLSKKQARFFEQVLISTYLLDNLSNARREISIGNLDKFEGYSLNIVTIFEGIVEQDILEYMER